MEMKSRGMYIARQLSFAGVHFQIVDVKLEEDFITLYDKCVEFVSSKISKNNSLLSLSSFIWHVRCMLCPGLVDSRGRCFQGSCSYRSSRCKKEIRRVRNIIVSREISLEALNNLVSLDLLSSGVLTSVSSSISAYRQRSQVLSSMLKTLSGTER